MLKERAWDSDAIRRHATRFGEKRFIATMHSIVAGPGDGPT